jgi:hypothetical protein
MSVPLPLLVLVLVLEPALCLSRGGGKHDGTQDCIGTKLR